MQANLSPKGAGERTANKTYTQQKRVNKYSSRLNEIESRRTVEQINKTRNWFFERINKIDKPLASLIKNKTEGCLGGSGLGHLPSTQGMILDSWD